MTAFLNRHTVPKHLTPACIIVCHAWMLLSANDLLNAACNSGAYANELGNPREVGTASSISFIFSQSDMDGVVQPHDDHQSAANICHHNFCCAFAQLARQGPSPAITLFLGMHAKGANRAIMSLRAQHTGVGGIAGAV